MDHRQLPILMNTHRSYDIAEYRPGMGITSPGLLCTGPQDKDTQSEQYRPSEQQAPSSLTLNDLTGSSIFVPPPNPPAEDLSSGQTDAK